MIVAIAPYFDAIRERREAAVDAEAAKLLAQEGKHE